MEALVPQVKQGGRPGKYERREILNGILYRLRTGCSWRNLAKDLPPWKIVHHYYRTWRHDRSWPLILAGLDGHRPAREPWGHKPGAWVLQEASRTRVDATVSQEFTSVREMIAAVRPG